jgi:hypothetical protein
MLLWLSQRLWLRFKKITSNYSLHTHQRAPRARPGNRSQWTEAPAAPPLLLLPLVVLLLVLLGCQVLCLMLKACKQHVKLLQGAATGRLFNGLLLLQGL